ncbi:MAG: DUF2924 domain-containing protein [Albidovulum sp.]
MPSDLPERLREITTLDRAGCVERWTAAFDTAPPKYLSIQFMQRVIARDAQIRALGGYPPHVRRALKTALRDVGGAGEAPRSAPPGSFLMREWNGRTYRVEVTSSGYVLDGRTYASLSTVANRITGTHWSGPRFFGLTRKRAS